MTQQLTILQSPHDAFPNPEIALSDPDGLLAIGGDLSTKRLINAYKLGIFPWFNPGEPIMWWSPSQRAVLKVGNLKISRSLKKLARQKRYRIFINHQFENVIQACVEQRQFKEGTWITSEMIEAYTKLHHLGIAHSIEIVNFDGALVGGLYGLMTGGTFCGESMFHRESNCSKLAFWALHDHLNEHGIQLIDCQLENPHLMSLGATIMPRTEFLTTIKHTADLKLNKQMWSKQQLDIPYD